MILLPAFLLCLAANSMGGAPKPARYVRIELPGAARTLSLAEVQVYAAGVSIGESGEATQSSIDSGGAPGRAIDGVTNGVFTEGSVTHTAAERGAWWEVDLGDVHQIERVVIWNRTDCCDERLQGFTIQLLDKKHRLLWQRTNNPAPRPRIEIIPYGAVPVTTPRPEEHAKFQPRIDEAIDTGVDYLLSRQLWDGSFSHHSKQYPAGSTGLALYTLLKCGVPRDHPAVARAVAYLVAHPPSETYELGTVLMALGALHDPAQDEYMTALLEMLLEHQGGRSSNGRRDGLWAYPGHSPLIDLSNSQYAALGLRAAHRAGLEIPKRAWLAMAEGILSYQLKPEVVKYVVPRKGTSSGQLRIAGFPYRAGGKATASMTTAGLGILGICSEGMGVVPGPLNRRLTNAKKLGEGWLTYNFSVESNVAGGKQWLLYYLYGLERVGALLGIETFGGRDWYWEGAKFLVSKQDANGAWTTDNESDTCFALLFLSRATANPSTGDLVEANHSKGSWISDDAELDVQWRITGGNQAVLFVSGFSAAIQEKLAIGTGSRRGLCVLGVDYLIDGNVISSLSSPEHRKWMGERFASRHDFPARGSYKCEIRVRVKTPGEVEGGESMTVLAGEPLVVVITDAHDPVLLEYPTHSTDNMLRNTKVTVSASTVKGGGQEARHAVDGLLGTSWMSNKDDKAPRLRLELARPQRGQVLLISQANTSSSSRGQCDRATKLRVVFNGKRNLTFEVDVPPGDETKCRLRLEKRLSLRSVEIFVLERTAGGKYPGTVGISEVEWL